MNPFAKVLVFGKNGQLARSIAETFRGENIHFVSQKDLDLRLSGDIVPFVKAQQPTLVINAAAYTQVDLAETEQVDAELINVMAPQKMAMACESLKIPLIHFSTDYVFDGTKSQPYVETDTPNPVNKYGETKLSGEKAVQKHCEKHLIFRVSWLYSEFGKNFFLTMLKLGKEKKQLRIVSDQIGAPTYARDVAEMLKNWSPALFERWGVYHFTNDGFTNWHGFAEEIFKLAKQANVSLEIEELLAIASADYKTPAARPLNSRLNMDKFIAGTGFNPAKWDAALYRCFNSYKSFGMS